MTPQEKVNIFKSFCQEIVSEEELLELFQKKENPIAYDGFEPSGKIHIAQGLVRALNVNKITSTGTKFKMWVADWHAAANHKFGGDLGKIQTVGRYFVEIWRASGMNLENVEFLWASDAAKDPDYWEMVLNVSRNSTLNRIIRTTEIMGRGEKDKLSASQILYPCMQVADIYYLEADIAQLGMDQRKVNMLARQVGPEMGYWKPISASHFMMAGLQAPSKDSDEMSAIDRSIAKKMSKSKPDTAVFMTDSSEDVERKIMKAYCPEGVVEENPILEYCKFIIFEKFDSIQISRPEKWGGNLKVSSYVELEKMFSENKLHPQDLKLEVARKLNLILDEFREKFNSSPEAVKLAKEVEKFQVTR